MKITYWSDYSCPYCWIGETRLKKALAQIPELADVEIEMKSFQLDPSAGEHAAGDTVTRFAKKYGLSMEDAAARIASISELGKAEGLDFRYATTLFTNTMDAHRLTKKASRDGGQALADQVSEQLFAAYFSDNLELADHEVLVRAAAACGMDRDEVRRFLATDEFRAEVLADEREAAVHGCHAVPCFLIGKYMIPGALDTEEMRSVLVRVMAEEAAAQMKSLDDMTGAACGPDGCHF